jgi:hypothetical protein
MTRPSAPPFLVVPLQADNTMQKQKEYLTSELSDLDGKSCGTAIPAHACGGIAQFR